MTDLGEDQQADDPMINGLYSVAVHRSPCISCGHVIGMNEGVTSLQYFGALKIRVERKASMETKNKNSLRT